MIDKEREIKVVSHPNCYFCGTKGEILYKDLEDRLFGVPGKWAFKRCPNIGCGLVWLDPMPLADQIPKLYEKYYTHKVDRLQPSFIVRLYERIREGILASSFGYDEATRSVFWRISGHILACIPFVKERIGGTIMWLEASQRGRFLDVGCGDGKLLQRMHNLGWNVEGIEPDNDAAEFVRSKFGLNVRGCNLEEAKYPDASFDVISMHHVIEHLADPVATLKECLRVLRQGGRLVLVTPNAVGSGIKRYGPDWRGLEPPRHLYLFTRRSIERSIRDAGFSLQSTRTLSRCAAQFWSNSDQIRHRLTSYDAKSGHPRPLRQKVTKVLCLIRRPVYQFLANILLLLNQQSGDEILLIAKKVGL